MPYDALLLSIEDGIARMTFNRPQVLNSLNAQLIDDIRAATAEVARSEARVLVMTGAGRAFCAGADLAQRPATGEGDRGAQTAHRMDTSFNPMMRELYALDMPKIAAVNGPAAGGGASLALLADITVAARSAYFVQVFGPRLGIVPDLGATWHLPHLVGRARARGLALLGDRLDAQTAADWGLIWQCVDDAELMPAALAIARRLRDGPTRAFGYICRALDAALGNDFSTQLDVERDAQRVLASTEDFAEGVAAFNAKRPPVFRGR